MKQHFSWANSSFTTRSQQKVTAFSECKPSGGFSGLGGRISSVTWAKSCGAIALSFSYQDTKADIERAVMHRVGVSTARSFRATLHRDTEEVESMRKVFAKHVACILSHLSDSGKRHLQSAHSWQTASAFGRPVDDPSGKQ
jgi:hypothetical protein